MDGSPRGKPKNLCLRCNNIDLEGARAQEHMILSNEHSKYRMYSCTHYELLCAISRQC